MPTPIKMLTRGGFAPEKIKEFNLNIKGNSIESQKYKYKIIIIMYIPVLPQPMIKLKEKFCKMH